MLENPYIHPTDSTFFKKPKTPAFSFSFIGALDAQVQPCSCFIRPNGGLERLENFKNQRQSTRPFFSLGSFFNAPLLSDKQSKTRISALLSYLRQQDFSAVLFSAEDQAFLSRIETIEKVPNKKEIFQVLNTVPWVHLRAQKSPKKITVATHKSLKTPNGVGFFVTGLPVFTDDEDWKDVDLELQKLLSKAKKEEILIVLNNSSPGELSRLKLSLSKYPMIFLSSAHTAKEAQGFPVAPFSLYLSTERKSRSVARAELWSGVTRSGWVDAKNVPTRIFEWEQALYEAGLSHPTEKENLEVFKKLPEDKRFELEMRLESLKSTAPNYKKSKNRFSILTIDLSDRFSGKNRLSPLLSKLPKDH